MGAPRPAGPRPLARATPSPRATARAHGGVQMNVDGDGNGGPSGGGRGGGEGLPDGMGGYFSWAFPPPEPFLHAGATRQDQAHTRHHQSSSPPWTALAQQASRSPRAEPDRAPVSIEQHLYGNGARLLPPRAFAEGTSSPHYQARSRRDTAMLREPIENLAYVPGQSARAGGANGGSAFLVSPDRRVRAQVRAEPY